MSGAVFYVALAAATIAPWLWFVRQVRDKQTQDALEELRVNLEKLQREIALALLPSFEKMAVAVSRMAEAFRKAGAPAAEIAEKLRNIERRRP